MPIRAAHRNGGTAPRRWLLSAPVPLPALGEYGQFIAVYDLDRVLSLDLFGFTRDLTQQKRAIQREIEAARNAYRAAWPIEQIDADPDAHSEALYALNATIRGLVAQQNELARATALRVLGEVLVQILRTVPESKNTEIEIADPTDPRAWEGWSDYILDWLTTTGMNAAQEQLTGPKAPPATATPLPLTPSGSN